MANHWWKATTNSKKQQT